MYRTLLVPLDGSEVAEQALPHAEALARAFGSRLILARVPETMIVPVMSGGIWVTREIESHEAHERTMEYLTSLATRMDDREVTAEVMAPHHPVAASLISTIEEEQVDLVVMTTHGHSGLGRWVMGSIADKLIRAAPAPVYVVRAQDQPQSSVTFECVMVPLDGSKLAETAIPSARALAEATSARLQLVRVPTLPGYVTAVPETSGWIPDLLKETAFEAESYVAGQVAELGSSGLDVAGDVEIVLSGGVAEGLTTYASRCGADVMVMSTHGRSGLGRWVFGSVADRVMHSSNVPVWMVRAELEADAA